MNPSTRPVVQPRSHEELAGERESYTLTCEKDGRVLQRERVFIDRGERLRLDLAQCRRRA